MSKTVTYSCNLCLQSCEESRLIGIFWVTDSLGRKVAREGLVAGTCTHLCFDCAHRIKAIVERFHPPG